MDDRVERDERHGKIAGIGCDAGLAGAEHRVVAGDAVERGAAAAGRAFVAGGEDRGIAEIGAARPLQQVAADRRHVADLCRGALRERLRDRRKMLAHRRIVGDGAHLRECADRGAAGIDRDGVEVAQMGDVDDLIGRDHAALGEVEQGRSARQQHGIGERGCLACLID